ncbi:MAG: S-layer homology domain-containing protein [Candidatus Gracilibacteria bacterium]|jgi:hypothetical protein|nr:S-layer homology domain-containing protein [Candidatus Gracilibacteria bacterium]
MLRKNNIKLFCLSLSLFFLFQNGAFALEYVYNGVAGTHLFSYSFPSNWFARTFGEKRQGFSPNLTDEKAKFEVLEFEGQSLKQVKNYFEDEDLEFVKFEDEIISFKNEDLIAKKAIYKDKTSNKNFALSFFKRGNLILATTTPNYSSELFPFDKATNEIVKNIYNSFSFNDGYRSYIDFENKFSLSFPEKFLLEKTSTSESTVSTLKDPSSKKVFFKFSIFKGKTVEEAIKLVKTINEKQDSRTESEIGGVENSEKIVFINLGNAKKTSYIFIPHGEDTLVYTDENTEDGFPSSNYHNEYIKEILASLEFFDVKGDYFPFLIFRDVRDNHPNANAINYLANAKVVQGYGDKTFGPQKEITRAELTKMLVQSLNPGDLSEYKNCFPDVKEDWYAPYVCFAKENNWITGYKDGKFKPSNTINRAEALKIIYEVLIDEKIEDFSETLKKDLATDISESSWYFDYYTYFENRDLLDLNHIVKGASEDTYKYLPEGFIKRQEVAETIYRMKLF